MDDEILVGLCIIPIIAIPFVFFGFLRYLRYRETLALAEKGLLPPTQSQNGRDTLRWGIVITALGLALTCGLYPIGWAAGGDFLFNFGPWMLVGLIPTAVGLALLIIYRLTRDDNGADGASWTSSPPAAPGPDAKADEAAGMDEGDREGPMAF